MAVDRKRLEMFAEWFATHKPELPPGDTPAGNVVMSHSVAAYGEVVIMRFAMHGFHSAEFHINPVAAWHLVDAILQQGQAAGWLDARGKFIVSDGDDE